MSSAVKKQGKLKSLFVLLRFLALLAIALIVAGYIAFLVHVNRAVPSDPIAHAEGIVVLTGAGNRLETGGQVFSQRKAERMLVTGIHSSVPDEDIRKLLSVSETLFSCCIDLDRVAKDTIGNARETAIWVKALGYEHIILVTSDYHMPRARLEITSATGGLRITPYPVSTKSDTPQWRDFERHKTLAKEYGKLLVIYVSRMGDRPSYPPQPVPAPTDVMKDAQDAPSFIGPNSAPMGPTPIDDTPPNTQDE